MGETTKHFLERMTPLGVLARRRREKKFRREYEYWKKQGGTLPMPKYGKQEVVKSYLRRFGLSVFVETGTYKGDMVYAVLPLVQKAYSIELQPELAAKAAERFHGYAAVSILTGRSEQVLPELLSTVETPCLFWLDAHYSGGRTARAEKDTPIMKELECILQHTYSDRHVILIDDAREFTGQGDYPTIEALKSFILERKPDFVVEVKDDIIRAFPQNS